MRATTVLNDYLDWPSVAQVGEIELVVGDGANVSTEKRYFITSVARARANANQLLIYGRGHWSIENGLHWRRDVTFGEDQSRIRTKSGPQVMAAFRNAAIGFLRTLGASNIAEALRRNAARVDQLFANLGIL